MLRSPTARNLNFVLAILLGLSLSSCAVYDRPYRSGYVGAPPVGVSYYDYWYYPSAQVYFDSGRGLYFYFSNNRWIETRVLPPYWRSRLGAHVSIHSRYKRPYIEHNAHRREYPPHAPSKYHIPERRDNRYTPPLRDYHEAPRKVPSQDRNREQRLEQEHNRYDYRYQPKAPVVKQPARPRYEESPRNLPPQERGRYNEHYQPKAPRARQPVRQRYEDSPRNKKSRETGKGAHKKQYDQSDGKRSKGRDDDRDRQDYRRGTDRHYGNE